MYAVTTVRAGWTWRHVAAVVAVVTMAAYAGYEAAVALDWISIRSSEGPPGEEGLGYAASVAGLAALVVSFASIHCPEQIGMLTRCLLPLAPAAWLVASYYSYDPYCYPSSCRVSEMSGVSPALPLACAFGAAAVAVLIRFAPRTAMALSGLCYIVFTIVSFVIGPWH